MKIHIITIFPESFNSFFSTSIISRAKEKWLFEVEIYKLNDFSEKKYKHIDDKAYWMHWQVISPEPLAKSIDFIFKNIWKKIPVLYMSPCWELLNGENILKYYEKFSKKEFIILCWHYEWIDERIIELYNVEKISIWEYVITSWELASQVFIDSLVRNIPWVLWNEKSLIEESFSTFFDWKKEHPVYTRPEIFKGKKVPKVLLSWNHEEIQKWKFDNLT
jgi:tRNA (guanine37-N1)-methyltransferase